MQAEPATFRPTRTHFPDYRGTEEEMIVVVGHLRLVPPPH